jgi:hypothetical protein
MRCERTVEEDVDGIEDERAERESERGGEMLEALIYGNQKRKSRLLNKGG